MENPKHLIDTYNDDGEPGFDLYEVQDKDFLKLSQQLALKFNYPAKAISLTKKSSFAFAVLAV